MRALTLKQGGDLTAVDIMEDFVWRGLRQDNPAAGLKAPRDRTERAERVKFLPLEGLRQVLEAPRGDGPAAVRDRAILALMGRHGLRVSEVAGLGAVSGGDADCPSHRLA